MSKRRARKVAFLKKALDAGKYVRSVVLERYGLSNYVPKKEETPTIDAEEGEDALSYFERLANED